MKNKKLTWSIYAMGMVFFTLVIIKSAIDSPSWALSASMAIKGMMFGGAISSGIVAYLMQRGKLQKASQSL